MILEKDLPQGHSELFATGQHGDQSHVIAREEERAGEVEDVLRQHGGVGVGSWLKHRGEVEATGHVLGEVADRDP